MFLYLKKKNYSHKQTTHYFPHEKCSKEYCQDSLHAPFIGEGHCSIIFPKSHRTQHSSNSAKAWSLYSLLKNVKEPKNHRIFGKEKILQVFSPSSFVTMAWDLRRNLLGSSRKYFLPNKKTGKEVTLTSPLWSDGLLDLESWQPPTAIRRDIMVKMTVQ